MEIRGQPVITEREKKNEVFSFSPHLSGKNVEK